MSEEETYKYLDEKAAAYRNKFTTDQVRKYNESKIYPKYGFKYKEGKMELEIDPEAAKVNSAGNPETNGSGFGTPSVSSWIFGINLTL